MLEAGGLGCRGWLDLCRRGVRSRGGGILRLRAEVRAARCRGLRGTGLGINADWGSGAGGALSRGRGGGSRWDFSLDRWGGVQLGLQCRRLRAEVLTARCREPLGGGLGINADWVSGAGGALGRGRGGGRWDFSLDRWSGGQLGTSRRRSLGRRRWPRGGGAGLVAVRIPGWGWASAKAHLPCRGGVSRHVVSPKSAGSCRALRWRWAVPRFTGAGG